MQIGLDQYELSLAQRALFSLSDAAGVTIACSKGCVWITLDGDARDIMIEAGESFVSDDHRRALISALEDSAITLRSGAPAARRNRTEAQPPRKRVFLEFALDAAAAGARPVTCA